MSKLYRNVGSETNNQRGENLSVLAYCQGLSYSPPMGTDLLRQFNALRESLKKEKEQIEARLIEIDQVLGESSARSTRPRNEMSLKEAIIQVTSKQPLSRHEVLEEVQKIGYKFNSSNPLNSIGVVVYGKNPKFKKVNGKFSPGK